MNPKTKTARLRLKLSASVNRRLRRAAAKEGVAIAAIVRDALQESFKRHGWRFIPFPKAKLRIPCRAT